MELCSRWTERTEEGGYEQNASESKKLLWTRKDVGTNESFKPMGRDKVDARGAWAGILGGKGR